MSYLGDPHDRLTNVHIAGTNGKGSVAAIISQVLIEEGYRVGVFTSPHLRSYKERIRVNQESISDDDLWLLIKEIEPAILECQRAGHGNPTEFETLTALAFLYFARQEVDVAVVETGMGGTYDSTNVVNPLVTAITNVGVDHLKYLGPGLQDVARNKAGIMKPGVPLIYGDHDPVVLKILSENSDQLGSSLVLAEQTAKITRVINRGWEGFVLDFSTPEWIAEGVNFSLPGSFQLKNLATALSILSQMQQRGYKISQETLYTSLPRIRWSGRLERIHRDPDVILDAAHNLHGVHSLAEALAEIYPEQKAVLVIGILDDKDSLGMLQRLEEFTRICIITRPEGERGSNWLEIFHQATRVFPEVYAVEKIEEAVKRALTSVLAQEYVLVTGSFMTLGRARRMFTQN